MRIVQVHRGNQAENHKPKPDPFKNQVVYARYNGAGLGPDWPNSHPY